MTRAARIAGCLLVASVVSSLPSGTARAEALGPPIADLLGWNVSAATRPSDDAVILYRGVAISVDAEGRVTRRVREIQRLLSDHAVGERGDPRVAYDTTRQELSIDVCRTFTKEGHEVRATPHAFNRVTPGRIASCADRCGLQEMVISYLGLERGCLTEIDYTLTDRQPWRPWAEGIEDLGDPAPVLAGEIRISADSLEAVFVGIPAPEESRSGVWKYGPLPGFPDEGGISPRDRIPHLVYSTCRSWKALDSWIRGRLDDAAAPDSAIRAWAREPLESGRPPVDDREFLDRVARLIGEGTNGADDAPLSWWLPLRPAGRTFDTSCGNILDRAALASAALRAAGMDPHARLVFETSTNEPPALSLFDDIRVDSDRGGSLSIAHGKVETDDAPWGSRPLVPDSGPSEPLRAARVDTSTLSIRIHENDDGSVRGEAAIRIHRVGGGGPDFRDVRGFLQNLASSYAEKGELAGFNVETLYKSSDLDAIFSFTGAGLGDSLGGGRRRIRIPSAPGMPEDALPPGMTLRRRLRSTPIILPFIRAAETVDLRLELAPVSRIRILPVGGTYAGPGTRLETRVEHEGRLIRIHRTFEVGLSSGQDRSVRAADYPAFRSAVLRRTALSANSIVIERPPEAKKR